MRFKIKAAIQTAHTVFSKFYKFLKFKPSFVTPEVDIELLSAQPIFFGLTQTELKIIQKHSKKINVEPPNNESNKIYKIKNALCIVVKGSIQSQEKFEKENKILEYQQGNVVNPRVLVEKNTVLSVSGCSEENTLLTIKLSSLKKTIEKNINLILLKNMVSYYSERFHQNENKISSLIKSADMQSQRHKLLELFFLRLIVAFSLYALSIKGLQELKVEIGSSTPITTLVIIIFALFLYDMMKRSGFLLSQFGLTTKNWKMAIKEALLFSVFFMLLLAVIKYLFIKYYLDSLNTPLFNFNMGFTLYPSFLIYNEKTVLYLISYIFFVPAQELLVRGGIQSSLFYLLDGTEKRKLYTSILISNLLFSVFHIHISMMFGILSFIPSLMWGFLYYRSRTLIGVTLAHIICGVYTLFILGINVQNF